MPQAISGKTLALVYQFGTAAVALAPAQGAAPAPLQPADPDKQNKHAAQRSQPGRRPRIGAEKSGGNDVLYLWGSRNGIHGRSEEHTSELQSRGHLVCR